MTRVKLSGLFLCVGVVWWAVLSGCIDDSAPHCARGVMLSFYSKLPYQSDSIYLGPVDNMALYVFDEDDILVEKRYNEKVNLDKAYNEIFELSGGKYTAVGWCGIGVDLADFEINTLQQGVTRKDDFLFRVKRFENTANTIHHAKIYVGESVTIDVPDYKVEKSKIIHEGINLQEITNRLTIEIDGISDTSEYEIVLEAKNGAMNINGTLARDNVLEYEAFIYPFAESIKAEFTVLKLQKGYDYTAVLRNKLTGKSLYREDLVRDLLAKNPMLNLDYDHDFDLYFKVRDLCDCNTYTTVEIWINNWLVYSYDTEL